MTFREVKKIGIYDRTITPPPDKSISVRAAILCAYAEGTSKITGLSDCGDALSALNCALSLGAHAEKRGDVTLITGARFRSATLDCGNSATAARLVTGIVCGLNGEFVVTGDRSLRGRDMSALLRPLTLMGARIRSNGGRLPFTVTGGELCGIDYAMPSPSAQVKSALLLAALNANSPVTVREKIKTRDHTERMLSRLGGRLHVDGNAVTAERSALSAAAFSVPRDISAAAFPVCLALATGGRCEVTGVGLNGTRTGFLDILKKSGARVSTETAGGVEPFGSVTVVSDGRLVPFELTEEDAVSAIDEIPALCALACFIGGKSVVRGARALRNKESDRIVGTVRALRSLGADVSETDDGIVVRGGKKLVFGTVDPMGDHRIAMAAAIAAAAGGGGIISDPDCVSVSYPSFFEEVVS